MVATLYSHARRLGEPCAAAPGAQERLLHHVLGLVEGAEHAIAVHVQLALVAAYETPESRLVVRYAAHP